MPSGILTITVLDANWNPLAERISFIKADDINVNSLQLSVIKKDFEQKELNTVLVQYKDSMDANLSLAVTDANISADTTNNIISYLLLTGQLKGKINNPAYYFADTSLERQEELDLVMLTNGWRKYKWHEIAEGISPEIKYPRDSVYFFLQGEVVNKKNKLPQKVSFLIKE